MNNACIACVGIILACRGTYPPALAAADGKPAPRPGYINHLPPEPSEVRKARHARIAELRVRVMLLVHRGASKLAPENTLEAYAAALDGGADGIEIDIRRSKDGVLYIHHDDVLGRIFDGTGPVRDKTYYDLLGCRLKTPFGPATVRTRIPTLAAVLTLARQRCALLHLDVKEPGLDEDIARMLEEADMWDHVVHITPSPNSQKLESDRRLKLEAYKGWFHEAGATPESRAAFMARPEKLIFIGEDPAPAVEFLGRKAAVKPLPLPPALRADWLPEGPLKAKGEH